MYETSIRIMSGYIARKYDNGDDIKMILNELKIPTPEKPEALDSTEDGVDKDVYIKDVKEYMKDNSTLTRSARKLYLLVVVKCTESLRAKIKGKEGWKKIDDKSNSMELLKMIKEIEFKVGTRNNFT